MRADNANDARESRIPILYLIHEIAVVRHTFDCDGTALCAADILGKSKDTCARSADGNSPTQNVATEEGAVP